MVCVQNTNVPPAAYINFVCGRIYNNNTPDGDLRSAAKKELLDRSTVMDSERQRDLDTFKKMLSTEFSSSFQS